MRPDSANKGCLVKRVSLPRRGFREVVYALLYRSQRIVIRFE